MFANAFTDLALSFSAAGNGPYWKAQVIGRTGAIHNDEGSIVTPGQVIRRDCMAQGDAATYAMVQSDGYAQGDIRILILESTLEGRLSIDDEVEILDGPHAGRYSLQSIGRDPAAIGFECRGRAL